VGWIRKGGFLKGVGRFGVMENSWLTGKKNEAAKFFKAAGLEITGLYGTILLAFGAYFKHLKTQVSLRPQ